MSDSIPMKIMTILNVLEFDAYLEKYHPRVAITCESFEKLQPLQFRTVFYFLFCKIAGSQKTKSKFNSVYPSRDIQQETEFRKITCDWLKELNEKEAKGKLGRILPIYFQRLYGQPFVALVYRFTSFALSSVITRKLAKEKTEMEAIISPSTKSEEKISKLLDYEAHMLNAETEVVQYSSKVEAKQKQNARKQELANEELERLANYDTADFLEKCNEKLEQDLTEVVKYISAVSEQIKDDLDTKMDAGEHRDASLIEELEKVEQMVNFIKGNHAELVPSLKEAIALKGTIAKYKAVLDRSKSTIETLKEDLARVKGQLFQTKVAKEARQNVKQYFKPFLDTPLTFTAYDPELSQTIARILKDAEAAELKEKEENA